MKALNHNLLSENARSIVDAMENKFRVITRDSVPLQALQWRMKEKGLDQAAIEAALRELQNEHDHIRVYEYEGIERVERRWA